jgi:hypothetical protein
MEMDWGKETPNQVYPEGSYKVRIESFERKTASTGTPQIMWRARIIEPVEFEGKSIVDYTALTEKALWRVAWLVSACGIKVEKLGKMDVNSNAFNQVLNSCVGRTVYWHVLLGLSNKGAERNEMDDYKKDPDQEPLDFVAGFGDSDVPEFLKE